MMKTIVKTNIMVALVAFTGLATAMHPDPSHGGDQTKLGDPAISDPFVQAVEDQLVESNEALAMAFANLLVSSAPVLHNQAKLEAYYLAGHNYYKMGELDLAHASFSALTGNAASTLLGVEGLRMTAQIHMAQRSPTLAIMDYQQALISLDAIEDLPLDQYEISLLTVLPMLSVLYESAGDTANELVISERIIDEITLLPSIRKEAVRSSGRSLMALNRLSEAKIRYQQYLDEYPDTGWSDGTRIEAQKRMLICDGIPWGFGYAQELEFCSDVLSNPLYRNDVARYDIGSHLVHILMISKNHAAGVEVVETLLEQVQDDIDLAVTNTDEALRLRLKSQGEGQLRNVYIAVLKSLGNNDEALVQIGILQADPDFGPYSEVSSAQFEIVPTP